jgi:hypothetical protein
MDSFVSILFLGIFLVTQMRLILCVFIVTERQAQTHPDFVHASSTHEILMLSLEQYRLTRNEANP